MPHRQPPSRHPPGLAWTPAPLWIALLLLLLPAASRAEDGSAAWLRYAPISNPSQYTVIPRHIVVLAPDPTSQNAAKELALGLHSELSHDFTVGPKPENAPAIVLTTTASQLVAEAFSIEPDPSSKGSILIHGGSPAALLYAVFHLLESVEIGRQIFAADAPISNIRWTDEWDNFDGTIERGYAGPSIFFDHGHVSADLTRAAAYARLLSSIGINGINVNNVNAGLDTLSTAHLQEFARLAAAFRPWGIRLAIAIDLSSPQTVGGLKTFDPLDPLVATWWQRKIDEIYALIPDLAGITVKADSEGRAGPSQYGRSPADAANVLARALRPHHGVLLYRAFVYNHHLDWHDPKADRARAGFDSFAKYDGAFEPNVIVQIKHGPIDFQAREPVSPLFAALRHTSQAIELETSQEYTGQQRHMVYLPSMWKWVLDTDLRVDGQPSTVSAIVTGRRFHQPYGAFVSVVNVGQDANWLHHPMAMANLYSFGKIAWNPDQNLAAILDTWTRLTWGSDPATVSTIDTMLSSSWHTYESYTGPNGIGTLTDILGVHFGPGIESAERNGWGQWFRGDAQGIGMDRTAATGTAYTTQYPPELAHFYEDPATCPDNLLLFFHHVAYNYKLHDGKTLVQSIYDTHYAGALAAAQYVAQWETLQHHIDPDRYNLVQDLLTYQAGHAIVWRDAINTWFHQISTIPDDANRVGHDPNRIEAEDMQSVGYEATPILPAETASNGEAVLCQQASGCTLTTTFAHPVGSYNIAIQYFDLRTGISHYELRLNGQPIASWAADATLPPAVTRPILDGQTSTRYTAHNISLQPGDTIQLTGIPDLQLHTAASQDPAGSYPSLHNTEQRELAPVDYIEFGPAGPITPQ